MKKLIPIVLAITLITIGYKLLKAMAVVLRFY